MAVKENKLIYKIGYQDGFEDGLIAAKQCSGCEYIQKCQDDPQKLDYCPNAKVRDYSFSHNMDYNHDAGCNL